MGLTLQLIIVEKWEGKCSQKLSAAPALYDASTGILGHFFLYVFAGFATEGRINISGLHQLSIADQSAGSPISSLCTGLPVKRSMKDDF